MKTGEGMAGVREGFLQEEFEWQLQGCLVGDERKEMDYRAVLGIRWHCGG